MPKAPGHDGTMLHYEEVGTGSPILFLHEFAGDHASWEPQMRHFARRHRCIAYSARGYSPSDIPDAGVYGFEHFRDDAPALLDHLRIEKAHLVGLSMGGYTALHVGLNHPGRVQSLTLAGTGSGSERGGLEAFRRTSAETARKFEASGSEALAQSYGASPNRVSFQVKDPRGYQAFVAALGKHDALGSARTMREFQGARPPVYDLEAGLRALAIPTLIVVGDEDDACIEPSLFLKAAIPMSGLAMFPKTGHVVNLEEPDLFNQALASFLAAVEAGRWSRRDPRSVRESA